MAGCMSTEIPEKAVDDEQKMGISYTEKVLLRSLNDVQVTVI